MRNHRIGWIALCVAGLALTGDRANQSIGSEIRITSPGEAADTDGNDVINSPNGSGAWRIQEVYPASDFASLPEGVTRIVGLKMRSDKDQVRPSTATFKNLKIRLSTTTKSAGELSMTFASNVGTDETLVLSGASVLVSTAATGPAGGPRNFDIAFDFQTPFEYDPTQGNLLLDYRWTAVVGGMNWDIHHPSPSLVRIIGNTDISSDTANSPNTYLYVRQFTFVPEPSAWILAATGLFGLLAHTWRHRRQTISGW